MSDTDFFDTPYLQLEWEPPTVDDYLRPLNLPPLESDVFNPLSAVEYISEMYDGQAAYEEVFFGPYPDLDSNLNEKR